MEDGLYVCHDEDFKGELDYLKAKVDAGMFCSPCLRNAQRANG